jgi:hypothetical protein
MIGKDKYRFIYNFELGVDSTSSVPLIPSPTGSKISD